MWQASYSCAFCAPLWALNDECHAEYCLPGQVYCGALGEVLTAVFNDQGGDGYCCTFGGGSYYRVLVGETVPSCAYQQRKHLNGDLLNMRLLFPHWHLHRQAQQRSQGAASFSAPRPGRSPMPCS